MGDYVTNNTQTVRRYSLSAGNSSSGPFVPTPGVTTAESGGTLVGSTNPNWRAKVKAHENATSAMVAGRTEYIDSPGKCQIVGVLKSNGTIDLWFNAEGGPFGGNVSMPALGTISDESANRMAAGEFYGSVRNKMSTFKGSVFAGEARQAQKMMYDRARSMIGMIDPYQRRLKRRWYGKGSKRAKLKALSDSWLELQFGWIPLASDIHDAWKALNNPRQQYARVQGYGSSNVRVSQTNNSTINGIGRWNGILREDTFCQVKYYGEVRAYKQPSGGGFLQDFGFTAREFLPTAWEVLPWSFAIDYFTNVSEIVNAVSYCSADITWSAKTTRTHREVSRYGEWNPTPDNAVRRHVLQITSPFKSGAKVSSVHRGPSSVPIPSLSWELPGLKQSLNLAALAVSRRLRLFS